MIHEDRSTPANGAAPKRDSIPIRPRDHEFFRRDLPGTNVTPHVLIYGWLLGQPRLLADLIEWATAWRYVDTNTNGMRIYGTTYDEDLRAFAHGTRRQILLDVDLIYGIHHADWPIGRAFTSRMVGGLLIERKEVFQSEDGTFEFSTHT